MGKRWGGKVGVDLGELGVAVDSREGEDGEGRCGDGDVGRVWIVDQAEQVSWW